MPLVIAVALTTAACGAVFSDSEPIEPYEPPPAHNACEEAFRSELMLGIGRAMEPPPTPASDDVRTVFAACTWPELMSADEHYRFPVGQQMSRLAWSRLSMVNGGKLGQLCTEDAFAATLACTSFEPSSSQ